MGLGVGRRPPPGRIPATAFAGANSDKALASSGIDPTGKYKIGIKKRATPSHTSTTEQTFLEKTEQNTAFPQIRLNNMVTLQFREEFP